MVKSMVPMAMVEKNKWLNQCCLWQGWKKSNGQINGAEGNGKPMFQQKKGRTQKVKNNTSRKRNKQSEVLMQQEALTTSTIRYLTLSYFIYSVLQKKRRYLAGDWIPKKEMNE